MTSSEALDQTFEPGSAWNKQGWLATDSYYSFWGNVFANELTTFLKDKIITDIGTGNGIIWEKSLEQRLSVKRLDLIDPDLCTRPQLHNLDFVTAYRNNIEDISPITTDVALFKQSFHLAYGAMGDTLFNKINAARFITFAMAPDPIWPMSPAFKKRFILDCPDFQTIMTKNGKKLIHTEYFPFPVGLPLKEWISMIENRFISSLHDVDDAFITQEIEWATQYLAEQLYFYDTLECLVFE